MPGNHHDLGVDPSLSQCRERFESVNPRQPDIQDDEVEHATARALQTRFARVNSLDDVPFVAQYTCQRRSHPRLVVDDEYRGLHAGPPPDDVTTDSSTEETPHGSSIEKRVPRGWFSLTSILPPCSTTIRRTIASPSPLPRPFVEK